MRLVPGPHEFWDLGFGFWDLGFGISGVTVAGSAGGAEEAVRPTLRFLPQDFHTCGKHCGKAADSGQGDAKTVISGRF